MATSTTDGSAFKISRTYTQGGGGKGKGGRRGTEGEKGGGGEGGRDGNVNRRRFRL